MKRTIPKTLVLLFTLTLMAASCGGGGNKPQLAQAALYLDREGQQATTSFTWRSPFYLIIQLTDAEEDTVIQASWIAMETGRLAPETVLKIEEKTPTAGEVSFELFNEGHFWPTGDYQVNIYLNGKLAQELQFEVYNTEIE